MAGIVGLTTLQHQNATSAMTVDASGYLTASQPVLAKLRLTSDQTDLTEEANNKVRGKRRLAYGDIGEQLDEIYKDIDAWKARIKSIILKALIKS